MSKKSRSKLWFLVHSWLALPIWFFVLIVCFTGTLAVVSQEIVWLAQPEVRASKPDGDPPMLGFDQVRAAVEAAQPGVYVSTIVRPDENGWLADTPEQWAAAISRLAEDPSLRQQMGAAGRRQVEDTYCLQAQASRLIGMLREGVAGA